MDVYQFETWENYETRQNEYVKTLIHVLKYIKDQKIDLNLTSTLLYPS